MLSRLLYDEQINICLCHVALQLIIVHVRHANASCKLIICLIGHKKSAAACGTKPVIDIPNKNHNFRHLVLLRAAAAGACTVLKMQ